MPLSPAARRRLAVFCTVLIASVVWASGQGARLRDAYDGLMSADNLTVLAARLSGPLPDAVPVTLLAIGDRAIEKWGGPEQTPLAAVAALLRIAAEGRSQAILSDIDLAGAVPGPDAAVFANLIGGWGPADPPLLLVRSIEEFTLSAGAGAGRPVFRARPTLFDAAVAAAAARGARVTWVSALNVSGGDGIVRRIRLWPAICEAGGGAYAAAALQVAALMPRGPSGTAAARAQSLQSFVAARGAAECGKPVAAHRGWPPVSSAIAPLRYVIGPDGQAAGAAMVAVRGPDGAVTETDLARLIPAEALVAYADGAARRLGRVSAEPFTGRAVLIGVTRKGSRDMQLTPLGKMPGVVVLANSVATAHRLAEGPDATPATKLAATLLLFAAYVLASALFKGAPATLLIGLGSLAMLLLGPNVIGLAAPVEAIAGALTLFGLFKLADSLFSLVGDWRRGLGWRALLKTSGKGD